MTDPSRSVFVNCPFDDDYFVLMYPMLFTLIFMDFVPRLALESSDSAQPRIKKIEELITSSRLSIHDISRTKARRKGEIFRLNMPFELGVDWASRLFNDSLSSKKFLVVGTETYAHQKALSDLSGIDVEAHRDDPEEIVRIVRNWFVNNRLAPASTAQGVSIWDIYNEFQAYFYDKTSGTNLKDSTYAEFLKHSQDFIIEKTPH